jgi:gamma-glutamylcyclotransferase
MKYFAYGSNMLRERLQATNRVPGATFHATGSVQGYRLRFHKRSVDLSGKCNIVKTDSAEDVVYGVVFEVPDNQLEALDSAEGLGDGYHHDYSVPVLLADGTEISALAYVADLNFIDDAMIPYGWYHGLVSAGAEQHQLPEDYIAGLRAVQTSEDPKPDRRTKREAETALNAYFDNIRA